MQQHKLLAPLLALAVAGSGCMGKGVGNKLPAVPGLGAAGVISNNGSAFVVGTITAPAAIIASGGGNIIASGGGNIIASGGGNIVGSGGSLFRGVFAVGAESPLAGVRVALRDAAGSPLKGTDGKPAVATTDAQGRYRVAALLSGKNVVVAASLPGQLGEVRAIAAGTGAEVHADAGLVSTLTSTYILDRLMAGVPAADAQATLDRLSQGVEADTRGKAAIALAGHAESTPADLRSRSVVTAVEALRGADRGLDQQLDAVRTLLQIGALSARVTDGAALDAQFSYAQGLTLDAAGNLYVADTGHSLIRKISPAGRVSTVAGNGTSASVDGPGTAASFFFPSAMAVQADGGLLVAEAFAVRRIAPDGTVSTLAGSAVRGRADGQGAAAKFNSLGGIVVDAAGTIYVTDSENFRICRITPGGQVTTLAGDADPGDGDGLGAAARFQRPTGLARDAAGALYVTDETRLRKVTPEGQVTSLPGMFMHLSSVAVDATGGLTVTESLPPGSVKRVTQDGTVTPLAGRGAPDSSVPVSMPTGVALDAAGFAYFVDFSTNQVVARSPAGQLRVVAGSGKQGKDGDAVSALFSGPIDVAGAPNGTLVVADFSGHGIRAIDPAGLVTTIIGGSATAYPHAVAVDLAGSVYMTANGNGQIFKSGKEVSVLAGQPAFGFKDGVGAEAAFLYPHGLAVGPKGVVYVADEGNNAIRAITPDGKVTTLAGGQEGFADGSGNAARFFSPGAVATDAAGNVYVADNRNGRIRKVTPDGTVTTLAGHGPRAVPLARPSVGEAVPCCDASQRDGAALEAQLDEPTSVTVGPDGTVYVIDANGSALRKIAAGRVTTVKLPFSLTAAGGIWVDAKGTLVLCDFRAGVIRRVPPEMLR
ncbi:MAG: hypothetical protein JWM80_3939 [Cyanobacteria bacterium RYN_339]|nr:hypothetical protein [Cyanobacteria bacterium RYN_339]